MSSDHPEYRLTYWHLNRECPVESLWFYSVEDVAERVFEHCRKLEETERVTFTVEWWTDIGTAVMVAHGHPRRLLVDYGYGPNITRRLAAGNLSLWERVQREAAQEMRVHYLDHPDGSQSMLG